MKSKQNFLIFMTLTAVTFFSAPTNAAKKSEKKLPQKAEEKIPMVERIRLVLKFGNSAQVRDSLPKLKSIKEDEQKSLIPQMKDLLESKDTLIQIAMIQTIGELKWKDLDSQVIPFLESEDEQVVSTAANIIRRKVIKEGLDPIREKLKNFDYTVSNSHINDFINTYSSFKDASLQSFMFEKLQDENVLNTYKVFMLKYLGSIDVGQDEVKKYLLNLVKDEKAELNMRIYAVRALGNMNYMDAKDTFKKKLEEIEGLTDLSKKRDLFSFRLELISSLVKLKDNDVKILLIQMTREDDELVRIRAIRRLAEFKSKEFTDLLEYKMKYDSSLAVQKEAKKALDIIKGKSNESSDDNP